MSLDELLTTVPEDVRQAIESVCDRAGTWDADWCILKAAGELIAIPELPPVSPENLVEGEWYVVKVFGEDFIGKYDTTSDWPRFRNTAYVADARHAGAIYGPLRFKIGGAS